MNDVAKPPALDLKSAALAGLVAGLVFLVMELVLVAATTGSPWGPPRMIAAIGMGEGVLPAPGSPPTFDLTVLIVAMLIHFALSVVLGLIWAALFGRMAGTLALIVGAVFGLAVYGLHFYGLTAVFPWFAMARGWVAIVSHAAFGLVLAATYAKLRGGRV